MKKIFSILIMLFSVSLYGATNKVFNTATIYDNLSPVTVNARLTGNDTNAFNVVRWVNGVNASIVANQLVFQDEASVNAQYKFFGDATRYIGFTKISNVPAIVSDLSGNALLIRNIGGPIQMVPDAANGEIDWAPTAFGALLDLYYIGNSTIIDAIGDRPINFRIHNPTQKGFLFSNDKTNSSDNFTMNFGNKDVFVVGPGNAGDTFIRGNLTLGGALITGTNTTSVSFIEGNSAGNPVAVLWNKSATGLSGIIMKESTGADAGGINVYNATSNLVLQQIIPNNIIRFNNNGNDILVLSNNVAIVNGDLNVVGNFNQVPLSFSMPITTILGNSNFVTFAHSTVPTGKTVTINYIQSIYDNGGIPGSNQVVRLFDATNNNTLVATNGNWNGSITITNNVRWYARFENNSATNISVSASIHGNIK